MVHVHQQDQLQMADDTYTCDILDKQALAKGCHLLLHWRETPQWQIQIFMFMITLLFILALSLPTLSFTLIYFWVDIKKDVSGTLE